MRLFLTVISVCLLISTVQAAKAAPWAVHRPKMVVVIVIDQFRADYISRFQSQFGKEGFAALINNGAYYPFGEYDILQSMTAPGHATVLTGAYPYRMGIPLNEWYDQSSHAIVESVTDPSVKPVGSEETPSSSPNSLIGSTVGDELKNSDRSGKVISISIKDRAAILLGGHRADLALWWDRKKFWGSSTFYCKDGKLPPWTEKLNSEIPKTKCNLGETCGVELTVQAFKAALKGENLGHSQYPDLMAVSFSSHDIAGHRFGPNSEQIGVIMLAEDRAIAEIRKSVQAQVPGGLKNVLFVLTGDHGVAPSPDYLKDTGLPSGRVSEPDMLKAIEDMLAKKYGVAEKSGAAEKNGTAEKNGVAEKNGYLGGAADFNFFLDEERVRHAKADIHKMELDIQELMRKTPEFAAVLTADEIEQHKLPPGTYERQILRTYYKGRSGHVIGLLKPFYIIQDGANKTTHMTSYSYDRMVPILFSGFGIKNGLYAEKAEVADIAPTLSFILGILPPALSEGRVLSESLLKTP